MPSLSASRNYASNPGRQTTAKKPPSKRNMASAKSKGKEESSKAIIEPETIRLAEIHEHFLRLLREEAKTFNDPFLLYLYDLVIYQNRVGVNENYVFRKGASR